MVGTRPDICYAVGTVSQYNSNPGDPHWKAVKQIMRYLKGTKNYSLKYERDGNDVHAYTDADWAGDSDNRRSTTGYVFRLGNGAISWNSRRQPTVALSSTEAEYMALTEAAKEAIWLKKLLSKLGYYSLKNPFHIFSDNQGAIDLGRNPIHHSRTKHIDIRHHFIREQIQAKEMEVEHCGTDEMIADVLTKGLAKQKHQYFAERLGLGLAS
jgi:ribonuclease HI